MAYASQEARQDLLDTVAEATEHISVALAALGAAYEQLDERNADRLEEELFRPGQVAYGRARRTHSGFAARHGVGGGTVSDASGGLPSQGVHGLIDRTLEAVEAADPTLADLQDSMRPVEVGDAELRAGLEEVRARLGALPERARGFTRTLGR